MPRIMTPYTDCAVYVYRSLEGARDGERQGAELRYLLSWDNYHAFGDGTYCQPPPSAR
jgi:hypothetical protein